MVEQEEKVEQVPEDEASTQLTEAELNEIDEGIPALEQLLSQEPTLKADIETVLREHTRKPITSLTLGVIANALSQYMDFTDMGYLIAFISSDEVYIQVVKARTSQEMWHWIRHMRALYFWEIREASTVSEKYEQSWRDIYRQVNFDTVTNRWGVRLEILRYNGERVILDETPAGAFSFVWSIIDALNTVPPEVAPDLIREDDIEGFLADVKKFSDLFAPNLLARLVKDGVQAQE